MESYDHIARGMKCIVHERSDMEDGLPYCGTIIGINSIGKVVYVWDAVTQSIKWTRPKRVYTAEESFAEILHELEKLCARYQRKSSLVQLKLVQSKRILDKYLRDEDYYIGSDKLTYDHLDKMAQTFEDFEKYQEEYNDLRDKTEMVFELASTIVNFTSEEENTEE